MFYIINHWWAKCAVIADNNKNHVITVGEPDSSRNFGCHQSMTCVEAR